MIDHFHCDNKSVSQDEDLSPGTKKKCKNRASPLCGKKIVDYRICIVWLVCLVWMEDYLTYENNGGATYENTSNFTLRSFIVIRKKFIQVIAVIRKIIKLKVQK